MLLIIYKILCFRIFRFRLFLVMFIAVVLNVWLSYFGATSLIASDIFSVSNVAVDVTSKTASMAKISAFQKAQRNALKILLHRLTRNIDYERLPSLAPDDLDYIVKAIEVNQERISDVRYLANIKVNFKSSEVRRLLRDKNIPFAESVSKPVLILPILLKDNKILLWEDTNSWREAWSKANTPKGLVPLITPVGDLNDILDVNASEVLEGNKNILSSIGRRYGASDILVVIASLSNKNNEFKINISANKVNTPYSKPILLNYNGLKLNEVNSLFAAAAANVSKELQEIWISQNIIQFNAPSRTILEVPLISLEHWVLIKKRLKGIASISKVKLISFSREAAIIQLSHYGDKSHLSTILAQEDLALDFNDLERSNNLVNKSRSNKLPKVRIITP